MTCTQPSITPLPHLGVISATGADAITFLHGQLTQDIVHLAPGASAPAALCSPKGRVLASMHALRSGSEEMLLIISADVLDATLARLRRYVLRAKVELEDGSAKWKLRGLLGEAAEAAAGAYIIPLPPANGTPRAMWVGNADAAEPAGAALDAAAWQLAEVQSGAARVGAATSGAFVPQMLGYESLGVLNFKKGCYPGQEVVARSQYRGAIKRRAFVAHTPGEALAGDEVLDAAGNSAGTIAQAAPAPDGGSALIAVLALDTAQQPLTVRGAPLLDIKGINSSPAT